MALIVTVATPVSVCRSISARIDTCGLPVVVPVRLIVIMPYRRIILSVWSVIDDTVINRRDHIIGVPWAVHIIPVVNIDKTGIIGKSVVSIVMDVQSTDPAYATKAVISDKDIARLNDPTVIVVVNWGIFNLNHRSKIVILHIGIIVVTRIETNAYISKISICAKVWTITIDIKIELAIGEYGKLNAILHKNEGITITSCQARCISGKGG
jgi:hypothetical protein